MNAIVRNIKAIMLVSGVLTATMIFAAIAPRAALQSNFGESLEGPLAELIVRNWGILIALVGVTMIAGRLLAIPTDDLFGVVSGVTGNPAILGYANRSVPTERPDIGYATVFPSMTVAKILFAQVAAVMLSG